MPWRTQRELNAFLVGDSGVDFDELASSGFVRFEHRHGDFEHQSFRTPTGKVELYSERLAALGLDPLPDWVPLAATRNTDSAFPLTLQTGLRERAYHHSRFRDQAWARKMSPDPTLRVHPNTAARLGIADGDWVRVETSRHAGACRLRAKSKKRTYSRIRRPRHFPSATLIAIETAITSGKASTRAWSPVRSIAR